MEAVMTGVFGENQPVKPVGEIVFDCRSSIKNPSTRAVGESDVPVIDAS